MRAGLIKRSDNVRGIVEYRGRYNQSRSHIDGQRAEVALEQVQCRDLDLPNAGFTPWFARKSRTIHRLPTP